MEKQIVKIAELAPSLESTFLPIYNNLNATKAIYPNLSLHELLQRRANLNPNHIAVEFNDIETTYEDLFTKANQLAHFLVEQGVKPGDFIGVSLLRSTELVATLIAILKCGAAFVPLDPNYPLQRLEFMLEDSEAKFLFTNKINSISLSSSTTVLFLEDALRQSEKLTSKALDISINIESTAYLLYTSGSTGKPKGVSVTHKSLVNLLFSMAKEPGIVEEDRLLAVISISFDPAYVDLFLPLLNGATIVMADSETARDGRLLIELVRNKNITLLQATATTWSMLLDTNWTEKLTLKACCGGEALSYDLAQKILAKCDSLWNLYGPTEATVVSLIKKIALQDEIITIGKPIANYQIYIVDANGQLVAPGEVGEIAISGVGVSKGYFKRDELTKEKFVNNRFSTSESNNKLYLSGDLGKLLPSGDIQCLGRIDHQVKIRGYRIELGEIEKTLVSIDNIKSAAVIGHHDNLIAFVTLANNINADQHEKNKWKDYLAEHLPEYFVPHDIKILAELPTTPNGKLDRIALLNIDCFTVANRSYTEPRNETEKLVATIWQKTLGIDKIDVFSDFFDVGGHSIKAVKVMIEIEKKTGKQYPLSALFEHSSIEKFANLLNSGVVADTIDCIVPFKPNGSKAPIFMVHGGGLDVLYMIHLSKHFDEDQPFYGIQGITSNGFENWYTSIEDMAAHYIEAIQKVNPEGPYAIIGYCVGGTVAYEMTRQLEENGQKVIATFLLDSYVDYSYSFKSYRLKKLARYYNKTKKRLIYLLQMLTSWEACRKRINSKIEYLEQKHLQKNENLSEEDALASEQFAKASGMMLGLLNQYQLKSQNIHVDLFRSKDHAEYQLAPAHLGWKKAALQGLTIHQIPGDDFDFTKPPFDKVVARMFQDVLNKKVQKI